MAEEVDWRYQPIRMEDGKYGVYEHGDPLAERPILEGLTEAQANRLSEYLKAQDDCFWKLLGAKRAGDEEDLPAELQAASDRMEKAEAAARADMDSNNGVPTDRKLYEELKDAVQDYDVKRERLG